MKDYFVFSFSYTETNAIRQMNPSISLWCLIQLRVPVSLFAVWIQLSLDCFHIT